MTENRSNSNPLLGDWTAPFALPPFDRIAPEHFLAAFAAALSQHRTEIEAIAAEPALPTFDNTLGAMERSGRPLDRVASVFFNLAGADTNDALQAIEREITPQLARHSDWITMHVALFARIDAVHADRDRATLTAEERRVLELTHRNFLRAGAKLDGTAKAKLATINERLAGLGTQFGQNVLADEKAYALVLDSEEQLAGLPEFVRASLAQTAADRGAPGKHMVSLSRSVIEPFLQFADRRDLRQTAYGAWSARGESGGTSDNAALIAETVRLRAEKAARLGFKTYADWKIDDQMAKTPGAARKLLEDVWPRARARAISECGKLQSLARSLGQNEPIAACDWRYYAEKVRKAEHDVDEAAIKPYFVLDRIIDAAFYVAGRLFGLTFAPVSGLPLYHADVRAYEVRDASGRHVGLFLGDYFARPSKRSGAWMSEYRGQHKLDGDIRPIVVNVMSFAKPAPGEPALLSQDDAHTLFHEFGHALHGLLSDVTYPSIAGTNVARDFVELPSQLFEHWLLRPEVLKRFAIHAGTGEPMSDTLIAKLRAARTFNQGFLTVEFVSSALYDLDVHTAPAATPVDTANAEAATRQRIGAPQEIDLRHRPPHFQHIFAGDGYSAGYYSYLWSEVLDADAFRAFTEAGDVFDPRIGAELKKFIYSAGGSQDPADLYKAFRGRLPEIDGLLEKRGLTGEPATE